MIGWICDSVDEMVAAVTKIPQLDRNACRREALRIEYHLRRLRAGVFQRVRTDISVGGVFLPGRLAAASVANNSPVDGLVERITIGGFLQWLFVIVLMLCASDVPFVGTWGRAAR